MMTLWKKNLYTFKFYGVIKRVVNNKSEVHVARIAKIFVRDFSPVADLCGGTYWLNLEENRLLQIW